MVPGRHHRSPVSLRGTRAEPCGARLVCHRICAGAADPVTLPCRNWRGRGCLRRSARTANGTLCHIDGIRRVRRHSTGGGFGDPEISASRGVDRRTTDFGGRGGVRGGVAPRDADPGPRAQNGGLSESGGARGVLDAPGGFRGLGACMFRGAQCRAVGGGGILVGGVAAASGPAAGPGAAGDAEGGPDCRAGHSQFRPSAGRPNACGRWPWPCRGRGLPDRGQIARPDRRGHARSDAIHGLAKPAACRR